MQSLIQRLTAVRAEHLRLAAWNTSKNRPARVALHHDAAQALAEAVAALSPKNTESEHD